MSDRRDYLEKKIANVQDSTYTTFHFMARLHNWLRLRSKTYYNWHLKKKNRKTNQYVLLLVSLLIIVGLVIFAFAPIFNGSNTYSFGNMAIVNEKLPKITNVKGEIDVIFEKGQINNRMVVYWYTDRPATSYVDYYIEGSSLQIDTVSDKYDKKYADALNRNHIVTIDNLEENSKYCFRVRSKDKDGFEAASDFYVVETPNKKKSAWEVIITTIESQFGKIPSLKDIIS